MTPKREKLLKGLTAIALTLIIKAPLASALPVFDEEFSCTTKEKADQYVRDFNINIRSFGGVELCNPKVDSKKLFNDLAIVEEGQFSPDARHNLVGNFVDSTKYYNWLRAQTEGMNRGNDVPWATAYNSMGYFTMQDGWAQLSTLGRVGVVVHEARHTEGFRHIPCTFGPYSGTSLPGCDGRFSEGGSHGVEMEYYARVVVFGQNFHPLYKKMARLMALGRTNFVFNQKVIQPREALFLIRKDSAEARLIDGDRSYPREVAGHGWLKRTSFGPTLFTPERAFALDAYEWLGDARPTEDGYSYFKLLTLSNGRPSGQVPKDLEELDLGEKRYLAGIDSQDRLGFYNFSKGGWGNFQNLPSKPLGFRTQHKDKQGLFIVTESTKLLQAFPQQNQVVDTNLVWDNTDVAYVMSPTREPLQLKTDGILRTLDGRPWSPAQDALWGQAVNIPLYNGFDVR